MYKNYNDSYVISSVEKLETIELIKFSLIITARIAFQSVAFSPSKRHMDSKATFTIAGGLAIDLTSTKCCFLIDLTAIQIYKIYSIGKSDFHNPTMLISTLCPLMLSNFFTDSDEASQCSRQPIAVRREHTRAGKENRKKQMLKNRIQSTHT